LIKLPCDPACDAVQLHAIQGRSLIAFGKYGKKVSRSHRRVKYFPVFAPCKAKALKGFINSYDELRLGIVGGDNRIQGIRIFLIIQQVLQFVVFLFPAAGRIGKGIGKTAPAHIPGQDNLFIGCGKPFFAFDFV